MTSSSTTRLSARDWFRRDTQAVTVEPRTPQERFPLHDHEFSEIIIVLRGNGWHLLNDEQQLITCGEVFYIGPDDRHAFEQVNDLFLTNIIYRPSARLLRPERLREILDPDDRGGRRRWQLTEDALGQLTPLLAELGKETRSDHPTSDEMAESLFVQLALALRRHRFAIDDESIPASARFGHLLAYLRRHCVEDLDVDEVARQAGYSPRTFNRMFRDSTATTPHQYLMQLRLSAAMQLLRTSEGSITDVAFACGFNDSNYFSSCFSKMAGCSPSEYRRALRGPDRAKLMPPVFAR